jgi:hypothetical protein
MPEWLCLWNHDSLWIIISRWPNRRGPKCQISFRNKKGCSRDSNPGPSAKKLDFQPIGLDCYPNANCCQRKYSSVKLLSKKPSLGNRTWGLGQKKARGCISQRVYLEPKWLRCESWAVGFSKAAIEHNYEPSPEPQDQRAGPINWARLEPERISRSLLRNLRIFLGRFWLRRLIQRFPEPLSSLWENARDSLAKCAEPFFEAVFPWSRITFSCSVSCCLSFFGAVFSDGLVESNVLRCGRCFLKMESIFFGARSFGGIFWKWNPVFLGF